MENNKIKTFEQYTDNSTKKVELSSGDNILLNDMEEINCDFCKLHICSSLYTPSDISHRMGWMSDDDISSLKSINITSGESICIIDGHDWDENEYVINCDIDFNKDLKIKIKGSRSEIETFLIPVSKSECVSSSGEYTLLEDSDVIEINKSLNKNYKYAFFSYN